MTEHQIAARRYSTVAIGFHWVIAVLIIFNLIVGIFHDSVPVLQALMGAHLAVGLTVLVLSIARIAWRMTYTAPPLPASVAAWERTTAKSVRTIFYILLLGMPLSGWLMVSNGRHPHPVSWFGLFDVPALTVPGAGAPAGTTHAVLGYLFAALVVLHIGAALRHHFLLRDTVLARMIPGIAPRG